jgi:transcriptional regulator with XRE-family HTH domain
VIRNIKELRTLADFSQYKLAKKTGIDRTRLSLLENEHVAPSPEEQATIERVLLAEIERRATEFRAVVAGTMV